MIVTAFFQLIFAPLILLLDTVPTFDMPTWLDADGSEFSCGNGSDLDLPSNLGCYMYQIGRRVGQVDGWLPTGLLFTVVGLIAATAAVVAGIRFVKAVISLVTGGGGS